MDELRELRELTGDGDGAQRVAWTDTWVAAKEWLSAKVAPTGAVEEVDEAGNQWFTLGGDSDRTLVIGGHIDSVPNGGWLDGRSTSSRAWRCCAGSPRTGRRPSPSGSSTGPTRRQRQVALRVERGFGDDDRPGRARERTDADGVRWGRAGRARRRPRPRSRGARAARERRLLSRAPHRAGPGAGGAGPAARRRARDLRRRAAPVTFRGQAAHAGSTPMDKRRDALAAAAKLALEIRGSRRAPATAPSARWGAA